MEASMRAHRIVLTLLLVSTLALALPAFAQGETKDSGMGSGMMGQGMTGQGMTGHPDMRPGQGMGQGGLMMMGMMGGCPMMGMMGGQGGPEAMVQGRLDYLKDELNIKKSQTKAWDAFAEAMRANAQSMMAMRGQMMAQMGEGAPSATQMLEAHMTMMESRLQAMRSLKPAMDELYKSLGSKQRKRADELMPGVGCMM
jgi:hypothetical protein